MSSFLQAHAGNRRPIPLTHSLVSFSEQLAATVEMAARSVVAVHARPRLDSSGVHWSAGIVVTADHGIRRDDDIRVTAASGANLPAELVGRDPGTDLAVLRVAGLNAAIDVPIAPRATNVSLAPGNLALAVGRSKDSAIAAFGVVGSISGPSPTWRGGKLDRVVRLDLSLHPGAEGAAVVDGEGKLVGVATSALSRFSVFAIPLETIGRVVGKLLEHGRIPRGYLGVGLQPVSIPEHLRKKLDIPAAGLIAVSVEADAAAGRAGMLIGDVLVELGGRWIDRTETLQEALDSDSIGKTVPARIVRGGEMVTLEITPGERPRRN
jgi:S1-C subfamily serine protease